MDETTMAMAEVAFAAGFGSVRRFNAVFRDAYGCAPGELRRGAGRAPTLHGARSSWRLRLDYRPPFDWERLLAFLAPRALPGVEAVADGAYRRTLRWQDLRGWIEVRPAAHGHAVDLSIHGLERCDPSDPGADRRLPSLLPLVERARSLFDLDCDPRTIGERLAEDPELAGRLEQAPGIRVPGAWEPFEVAVRAVLGQQVTVRGATTLAGRLIARWGEPLGGASAAPAGFGGLDRQFPTPEVLAAAPLEEIGMPGTRAEAIRRLAAAAASGGIGLDGGVAPEEAIAAMRAVRGLGDWTVQYVAMRVLGDSDAFPASDLHLRRALGRELAARALERRSQRWRPWRAYAAMLLWQTAGDFDGSAASNERTAAARSPTRPIRRAPRASGRPRRLMTPRRMRGDPQ
ncbi:MAG TPA: AlkA N-terminal domain-containing protein [Thermoanaerobaculia bacterium]|nr:AlkA N-terminal domain-containing protein [Thermoanaerobaculia bacterium]